MVQFVVNRRVTRTVRVNRYHADLIENTYGFRAGTTVSFYPYYNYIKKGFHSGMLGLKNAENGFRLMSFSFSCGMLISESHVLNRRLSSRQYMVVSV